MWRRWRIGNENKQKTATLESRLVCDGHIVAGRAVVEVTDLCDAAGRPAERRTKPIIIYRDN